MLDRGLERDLGAFRGGDADNDNDSIFGVEAALSLAAILGAGGSSRASEPRFRDEDVNPRDLRLLSMPCIVTSGI